MTFALQTSSEISPGIDAASSFIQGYWIWSKIVENLAVVGYDTNNLLLAAYDWRLSYWNLEERDGYFSRLKSSIEEYRFVIFLIPYSCPDLVRHEIENGMARRLFW